MWTLLLDMVTWQLWKSWCWWKQVSLSSPPLDWCCSCLWSWRGGVFVRSKGGRVCVVMPPSVCVCMLVGGWVVESPSTNRVLSILDIKWTDRLDLSAGNCVDVGFLSRVHPPNVGLRGKTQSAAIHADPAAMIWADDGHVGIITHPPPRERVLDPYCWVMKSHSWEGWAESQWKTTEEMVMWACSPLKNWSWRPALMDQMEIHSCPEPTSI